MLGAGDNSNYEISTLYFGNLHRDVNLPTLQELCVLFGPVEYAKIIRDKITGASAGYAFVRFAERAGAVTALHALNGRPWAGKELRLNWAFQTPPKDDAAQLFNIFVGDLSQDVNDATLYSAFRDTGCCQARVLWDQETGLSKRYGFVSYRSRGEGEAAIVAMQGQYVGLSNRVRCRWAQHKQDEYRLAPNVQSLNQEDALNTSVYVGNIPQHWTDLTLCSHFSAFGPVVEARLHRKGGFAFVRFEMHDDAVAAIVATQGTTVEGQVLKCSWGKSVPANQPESTSSELPRAPHSVYAAAIAGARTLHRLHPSDSPSGSRGVPPWVLGSGGLGATGAALPWHMGGPADRGPPQELWGDGGGAAAAVVAPGGWQHGGTGDAGPAPAGLMSPLRGLWQHMAGQQQELRQQQRQQQHLQQQHLQQQHLKQQQQQQQQQQLQEQGYHTWGESRDDGAGGSGGAPGGVASLGPLGISGQDTVYYHYC